MSGVMLSYQQIDPVKLQCKIDLKKLLPDKNEREKFEKKWEAFLESDSCNIDIFKREGDYLIYQSEQLIPEKLDNRPPLLLILGNPASHSVKEGMFFSFEGDKKEHRFWKRILKPAGVLDLPFDSNQSVTKLNKQRREALFNLKYDSPFRIGLCVFRRKRGTGLNLGVSYFWFLTDIEDIYFLWFINFFFGFIGVRPRQLY